MDTSEFKQQSTDSHHQARKSLAAGKSPSRFGRLFTSLGFHRGYNVPLFIILAGAMVGFSLARLQYLDVGRRFREGSSPGEWYWYKTGSRRVGITLHLAGVIPAGLLMVWQFVPAIRHRCLLFHRINGYLVILLLLVGNVGALMITRRAFGGDLATQGAVGVLVIYTTTGMALAYYNVKMLQIDQHRAWMLRTMVIMGVIITTRIIMIIAAQVVTAIGSYNVIMSCGVLSSMHGSSYLVENYANCLSNSRVLKDGLNIVHVNFGDRAEEIGASLRIGFGMSLWISIFLHGVGVEVYLALTPREAQRLREVSYEKQLEAGLENPGSAGLVIEKFGDADDWKRRR
ncbi:uncharacterized protein A1O9_12763 [Exophiala aquamarina CBS 119918]|uniref:DUF2306 domain-containing protein n=1 Tax=Exophiala aquamarina CBS 119918 TaxID=1182545 RepID=A0A072NTD7_9EURO|nr:uncharacterized protein A1O9_12763 [Exophiala aquamarina CBS 119918]KEF51149.1 hypothetical protein A1O9_12763 [Exophiala aquamarina CBS 119918]